MKKKSNDPKTVTGKGKKNLNGSVDYKKVSPPDKKK